MTSLNPLHRIGRQIVETLRLHRSLSAHDAERQAVRLLERVGLPEPRRRMSAFPHQLSGGQRQRVMIAVALACGPEVLIADEPTTALDVTTQRQVLDLLATLVDEFRMALVLISHNLAMIGERADEVAVMYGGRIVEHATTGSLFARLAHPYTQGLFRAMPVLGHRAGERLVSIPGTVPDLADLPAGCAFADRCPLVRTACRARPPELLAVAPEHRAACFALIEAGA
jgi:peptide/nickel transport system ATP-binding protein